MKLEYTYPQLFREGKDLSEEIIRMMKNLAYNLGVYQKRVAVVVNTNSDATVWITTDQTIAGKKTFTGQIESTLAIGTSPFDVDSTTVNTNLNADYLDGQHGSYYAAVTQAAVTEISSFENSWVNSSTTNVARYWKDTIGMVHVFGVIKDGTLGASCFTLPAGYRPDYNIRAVCMENTTPSLGVFTVSSAGVVTPSTMFTSNVAVNINIHFRAYN